MRSEDYTQTVRLRTGLLSRYSRTTTIKSQLPVGRGAPIRRHVAIAIATPFLIPLVPAAAGISF